MGFVWTIASISFITIAVLFYTGFGVTRLLAFQRIHGQELLIAPFAGFALLVTLGYWCGWLGWSIGVILPMALVLATCFNALALVRFQWIGLHIREHLPILALAAIAVTVALYPMWRSGTLGPIGVNGDQVLYVNVADHLGKSTFPAPPPSGRHPAMLQLSMVSEFGFPLGLSYLHAFIDTLAWREAHATFSFVTAVSLALSVLAYAALAECLFGASRLGGVLVALFTAVSPALMWVHYNNYGMHVISLGLVPLAFGLSVLTVEEGMKRVLLPALLLSAAFATYPPAAAVFALFPTALYVIVRGIQQRGQLAANLRTLVTVVTLAALLNLPGVLHAGKFLLHTLDLRWVTQFGDVTHYVPWAEMYGLSHHRLPAHMGLVAQSPALSFLLALLVLLVTLFGVWRTRGVGRVAFLSLAMLYVTFTFWLRYGLDYPYGFFKALTFATFPALTGLALGLEGLLRAERKGSGWPKLATAVALGALTVAINLVNLSALSRWVVTIRLDFPSLLALRDVKGLMRGTERIHIRDARDTPLLWMTYFLKDYDLSLAHYTPYYMRRDWPFYQDAISADLVLVNKEAHREAPWAVETLYENRRYMLLRKGPKILTYIAAEEREHLLQQGEGVRIEVMADRLVVDGRSSVLGRQLHPGEVLRLGLVAPAGSRVRMNAPHKEEAIVLPHNVYALDFPIVQIPSDVTLTNESERTLLVLGWLEVIPAQETPDTALVSADVFGRFREETLPDAGFFVVSGWYALDEGQRRWTKGSAFTIFRNPQRPVALNLAGHLPPQREGGSPAKAAILLNGHVLGEVDNPGSFQLTYRVPETILGSAAWGYLEIHVNETFNPKALGLSQDARDLGILMTHLEWLTFRPE